MPSLFEAKESDFKAAIRRIPALRPHVAILDARLPDGSGIEVCRQVRALDPAIAGLILTSYDDEQALTAAVLAGAALFSGQRSNYQVVTSAQSEISVYPSNRDYLLKLIAAKPNIGVLALKRCVMVGWATSARVAFCCGPVRNCRWGPRCIYVFIPMNWRKLKWR